MGSTGTRSQRSTRSGWQSTRSARSQELSAGQQVRVSLARAIAARPLAIVADEPTARLDAANSLALGTLLAELARTHGTTVICATHDPLLIEQADVELSLASV